MSEIHVPGRPTPSSNPLLVLAESFRVLQEPLERIAANTTPTEVALSEPHVPVLAPLEFPGTWGVFCFACTKESGTYVHPCAVSPDTSDWPPQQMIAATSD